MEKRAMKTTSTSSTVVPVNRRSFLSWMSVGVSLFSASITLGFLATLRFFFPNTIFEPAQTFHAGSIEDFSVGSVDERFKEKHGIWIVRTQNELFSLSSVCTHLGCTPNWFQREKKFKCPCHGSVFTSEGRNISGPAPRSLERYRVYLGKTGKLFIDKNTLFREEKWEWKLPGSRIVL
ncbi:MAG: ubiquinol-cytochrome c reductase iron-sulfur subunit [Nitrospinota bacterium]